MLTKVTAVPVRVWSWTPLPVSHRIGLLFRNTAAISIVYSQGKNPHWVVRNTPKTKRRGTETERDSETKKKNPAIFRSPTRLK